MSFRLAIRRPDVHSEFHVKIRGMSRLRVLNLGCPAQQRVYAVTVLDDLLRRQWHIQCRQALAGSIVLVYHWTRVDMRCETWIPVGVEARPYCHEGLALAKIVELQEERRVYRGVKAELEIWFNCDTKDGVLEEAVIVQ